MLEYMCANLMNSSIIGFMIIIIIKFKQMLPSWVQQFETLQQYLTCLFDSLECIDMERVKQAKDQGLIADAMQLLIKYGRKIMELSEQSTYKHRNQYYLSRKEVQYEMQTIYKYIVGEQSGEKYQKMVKVILQKFQDQRKSIWNRFSMPQSRIIPSTQSKNQRVEGYLQEQRTSNIKTSKVKSKNSKISTVKELLQIKNYFEDQQNVLRQFFDKMNKMMQFHKIPTNHLQQNLKYSRRIDQNNSEKIIDFIKFNTQTHSYNIRNLCSLAETFHQHIVRRLKTQGFAESKLSLYMEEMKRMEQVYSYTLSKMLQKLTLAKQALPQDKNLCQSQLQSLEQITRKLYNLYPSQQSFKQLTVKLAAERGNKNYGVQVNMGKQQQQKKTGSQAFRLQVRVNQCIEKFQRNTKFRKTFQLKQVQKLLESIRQILPVKQAKSESEISYQEQFKNLMELQEKREKETIQSYTKKLKKSEKRIVQLQAALQQIKKQAGSVNEDWQQQRKKMQKKIEHQQSEYRRLSKEKANLDSNLSQYILQIEKMREEVRRKGEDENRLRRSLQRQCEELRQKWQTATNKYKQASDEFRTEKEKMSQQRIIYQNKIELTEGQLEEQQQLCAGFRVQLQSSLNENRKLKQQLSQMSRIYQQKIRELDGMIDNLRQLHQIKQKQESKIQQLHQNIQQYIAEIAKCRGTLEMCQIKILELNKEKISLQRQVQHWKQQGKLTDSDLRVLKDEVQKVSRAYIESEEQLQLAKHEYASCNEQREKLFRQRLKLNRVIEDLQGQMTALKAKYQAIELAERDIKEEYYQVNLELKRNNKQIEALKGELAKTRKELLEEREDRAKNQKELRQLRQQNQSKRQSQSVEQGKRRIQLQNLRVELRKKTDQLEKQKESYQQKLGICQKKMKQLQQFQGQKQLLSRLMNSHQTQ